MTYMYIEFTDSPQTIFCLDTIDLWGRLQVI
jgi:hypothetical protein